MEAQLEERKLIFETLLPNHMLQNELINGSVVLGSLEQVCCGDPVRPGGADQPPPPVGFNNHARRTKSWFPVPHGMRNYFVGWQRKMRTLTLSDTPGFLLGFFFRVPHPTGGGGVLGMDGGRGGPRRRGPAGGGGGGAGLGSGRGGGTAAASPEQRRAGRDRTAPWAVTL